MKKKINAIAKDTHEFISYEMHKTNKQMNERIWCLEILVDVIHIALTFNQINHVEIEGSSNFVWD